MTPLRRRMTEDLILHNLSPKTSRLSINWVTDFARHFHAPGAGIFSHARLLA